MGEGVGRYNEIGVEEIRRKPSSIWSEIAHSGRCFGGHSTM
jgi:hypothetical protein